MAKSGPGRDPNRPRTSAAEEWPACTRPSTHAHGWPTEGSATTNAVPPAQSWPRACEFFARHGIDHVDAVLTHNARNYAGRDFTTADPPVPLPGTCGKVCDG